MKKIFVLMMVFFILSVQTVIGQEPLTQKLKTIGLTKKNQVAEQSREIQAASKTGLKSNVTVIDVRNSVVPVSHPGANQENITSNRTIPSSGSAAESSSLNASQLKEILNESGMQFTPVNLYMRLSPKQISEAGKGYLYPYRPYIVVPDFIIFDETYTGIDFEAGIHVVLKEAGTYVLDFLVEIEDAYPVGKVYPCKVLKGLGSTLQTSNVAKAEGPQHVLVVVNYDGVQWAASVGPTQVNLNQIYGLHFDRPEGSNYAAKWKFYRVDVTKM